MAPSPSPSAGEGSNENLTTDQKVAFRKLAKASVARHEGPFAEFVPVDVRPIQQLSETVTLEDLRRQRLQSSLETSTSNASAPVLPTLKLPRRKSTFGEESLSPGKLGKAKQWSPVSAARQQLATDKGQMLQRMEDTVLVCRAEREDRFYRLNSLGVFDAIQNDTRARSMLRVALRKELSTTSMRLPHTQKEVKHGRPDDSVPSRLERMFNRVLRSIDDPYQRHRQQHFQLLQQHQQQQQQLAQPSGRQTNNNNNSSSNKPPRRISYANLSLSVPSLNQLGGAPLPQSPGPPVGGGDGDAHSEMTTAGGGGSGGGPHNRHLTSNMSTASGPSMAQERSAQHMGSTANASVRASHQGGAGSTLEGARSTGSAWGLPSGGHTLTGAGQSMFGSALSVLPGAIHSTAGTTGGGGTITDRQGAPGGKTAASLRVSIPQVNPASPMPRSPGPPTKQQQADWREALPPEIAAAHMAHLSAITEAHIKKYHRAVLQAQDDAVRAAGLELSHLELPPDELAGYLEKQGKEEEGASLLRLSLAQQDIKEVSRVVLQTKSIQDLITAALEHCDIMSSDLEAFKATVPRKDTHKLPSKRARKPSIPMAPRPSTKLASAAGAPDTDASAAAPEQEASGQLWPSMLPQGMSMRRGGLAAESDAGTSDLSSEYDECMSEAQAGDHTSHATSAVNSPLLGQGGRRARHGSSVSGAKAQQQGLGSGDQQQGPHQQGSGSSIHNRGGLQGLGSSSEGAFSSRENSGPVLPSAPLINHTPITATRLENFRMQLEEAVKTPPPQVLLPPLPPAPTAALYVQARLERIWNLLLTPLTARLDMVLEYTRKERVSQLEAALEVWEKAAVAVASREELLASLTSIQLGVEDGSLTQLSVGAVERQCVSLMQVTAHVMRLAQQLREEHGAFLMYEGMPYPGEVPVGEDHMVTFMMWLRDYPRPDLRLVS